jgi:hypothetical protein
VGQLVSIPQPNHARFNRPNKWALLRRGPYEIMKVPEGGGTTLSLRDHKAHNDGRSPRCFQWPKRWVFPYHVINEEALEDPEPPPPPEDDDVPELMMDGEETAVSAILGCQRLPEAEWLGLARGGEDPSLHVRNNRYLVRWSGKPHSENSWEQYARVWHTNAFQEFMRGSTLRGHVPPSQYAARHRNHVNALVRGRAPAEADRQVVIQEAQQVVNVMQGYMPLRAPAPRAQGHIQQSQEDGSQLAQQEEEEEAEGDQSQRSQGVVAGVQASRRPRLYPPMALELRIDASRGGRAASWEQPAWRPVVPTPEAEGPDPDPAPQPFPLTPEGPVVALSEAAQATTTQTALNAAWLEELEGAGDAMLIYEDDLVFPTGRGNLVLPRRNGLGDMPELEPAVYGLEAADDLAAMYNMEVAEAHRRRGPIMVPRRHGGEDVWGQQNALGVRADPGTHLTQSLLNDSIADAHAASPQQARAAELRLAVNMAGVELPQEGALPARRMSQLVEGFRTLARSRDRTPPRGQPRSTVEVD